MGLFNIAVVSDKNSWISPYVQDLRQKLESQGHTVFYANNFDNIRGFDIVFILSFSRIITERQLKQNTHNLVVHESALPHGKGWSPLTWQILEGKESFPITLFEAAPRVDSGKIYLQKDLHFTGTELVDDLREIQGSATVELCMEFVSGYDTIVKNAHEQNGLESFYPRRTPKDSEMDEKKSIAEQFNLLRVVDNEKYPAFFIHGGCTYILKIYKGCKEDE